VDNLLNWVDAILLAITYGAFFIFSFRTATTVEKTVKRIEALQVTHKSRAVLYIIIGVVLLLAGGFGAVRSLLFLSEVWHWPPFVTGFVVLAVGSNTPELALLVTSLLKRRRAVALGDYIGSATFNTLLAVVLIDMNEGMITFSIPLFLTSILFVAALGLFWFFGATDTKLTVTEATVLLGIYVALTSFQAFFSTVVL
jgi:cation:H+ antiporter